MKEKKCLVIGSGISGIGAVSLLQRMGAEIILFDANDKMTIEELRAKVPEEVNCECYVKELPGDIMKSIEVAVLSPGVPTDSEMVEELRKQGAGIIGEIELGFLLEKGRVVAITGTNGKTTTTTLVGEIMKAWVGENNTFVVGNIGNSYTLEAHKTTENTITVGEISSFQLETVDTFHPKVSAILNVTPDHLNRHHTMENYAGAKENIAANQTKEDVCVLNYENSYTREFGERCPAKVVYFSSQRVLPEGYYLKGEEICMSQDGKETVLLNIHTDMNLVGICNVENVMAAIALSRGMGTPMDVILKVIKEFQAVEHRIEYVATKRGVKYYNDSKGTNPDAAIQGIRAMSTKTILIGGGYDKGNTYDEWIENFDGKVKWLVLIGQTKEKIAECAKKHGFTNIKMADTFEECLELCTSLALPGEAVLLSPACASWGMFPNYEVRGKQFKEYVQNIKE